MNVLVDENIPRMTVQALKLSGYNVIDNRGTAKEGLGDEELWQMAQDLRCLLVTTDKGFANKRNEVHQGILIVRLRQPNRQKIHVRVMQAMNKYSPSEWPGLTIVVRDTVQSIWRKV